MKKIYEVYINKKDVIKRITELRLIGIHFKVYTDIVYDKLVPTEEYTIQIESEEK